MPIFGTEKALRVFRGRQRLMEDASGRFSSLDSLDEYLRGIHEGEIFYKNAKAGGRVLLCTLFLGPASDDGRRERVALWGVEGPLCTSWCEYPAGFKLFVVKGEACVRRQGLMTLNGFQGGVLEDLTSVGSLRCRIEVEAKPRYPLTVFLMYEPKGFRPLPS
jgi:hypothetical protein